MQLNDEEKIVQNKSDENPYDYKQRKVWQARSQKLAIEEAVFGGLGAKPPAARGNWGSGGKAPSRRRHGGPGAEPPALENFAFFFKNNLVLGLY